MARVEPSTIHSEADPFWLILSGGNGCCDALVDVFKDPPQTGLTLRIKLNDPSLPVTFIEYQVMPHDLRAFAQWILAKLRGSAKTPDPS